MKRKSLALLFALGSATGCAHYTLPVNHLDSPEARGGSLETPSTDLRSPGPIGRLEFGALGSTDLTSPSELQYPDPAFGGDPVPMVQSAMVPAFGFSVGLGKYWDLGIRMQPQSPLALRLKHQFYGEPEKFAGSDNFSAAISVSPGILFGKSGPDSITFFSADVALPLGYRLDSAHLVSFTPFLTFASFSGTAENAIKVADLPDSSAPNSLTAIQYGGGLGYQYQLESLFLRAEVAYAAGSISQSKILGIYAGTIFGFAL